MKRIPKAFKIGSFSFTVEYKSEKAMTDLCHGTRCYGLFLPDKLTIYLEKPTRKIKRAVILQTFWHEYAHAMMWVIGHKDYNNEKVIDAIGHALKQVGDTAEY